MRIFAPVLLLFVCGILHSQTSFIVKDKVSATALSEVIITYRVVGQNNTGVLMTDHAGAATISEKQLPAGKKMIVVFCRLGYQNTVDTLESGKTHSIAMLESGIELKPMVITGQYAPVPVDKAVQKMKVIDAQRINNQAAVNLKDVLGNELNVRISQDNILGSSMQMQGLGGMNVKILIDGVPVIGRMDGNIDLSQLNLNDVERIEIVEGPMAVTYGTDALAGAINIVTRKESSTRTGFSLQQYTESIGTFNSTGSVSTRIKKSSIRLSGGRNYFDGWHPGDAFLPEFSAHLADSSRFQQWKPREQYFGRLQWTLPIKAMKLSTRTEAFDENIISKGKPIAPYYESAFDDKFHTRRLDQAVSLNGPVSAKSQIQFTASANYYQRQKNTWYRDLTTLSRELTTNSGDQDTSTFMQYMSRASYSSVADSSKWAWEAGYDIRHETAEGVRINGKKEAMSDFAVYSSAEFKPWKGFSVRPGLRLSKNTAFKTPLIPSLHIKQENGNIVFRASYGRGFRAPALKELYFYFVDINHNIIGNPDLKAEYSNNLQADVQLKQSKGRSFFQYSVSGFHNTIHNLITLAMLNNTEYTYVNIGEFRTMGLNGDISLIRPVLRASIGGSWIGRSNSFGETGETTPFVYAGEVRTNFEFNFRKQGISAALFLKYQGKLPGFAIENNEVVNTLIGEYTSADLTVNKSFSKERFVVGIGCKNLFNVRQVVLSGPSGGAHSSGGTSMPVATGRFAFLKLAVNFNK